MAEAKEVKLLPCPFCGKKPVFHREFRAWGGGYDFCFTCTKCGVTKYGNNKAKAVKSWNKRYAGGKNYSTKVS